MSCAHLVAVSTYRPAAFVRCFGGLARLKFDYVAHLRALPQKKPAVNECWENAVAHPKKTTMTKLITPDKKANSTFK